MESRNLACVYNPCVENRKMGTSLRIRLAAKACPGKSSRVTAAPPTCPRRHSAIKLRLRRLSGNGLDVLPLGTEVLFTGLSA